MTQTLDMSRSKASPVGEEQPRRFVFLLLPEFSQISFACALEALRMANGFDGRKHFDWHVLSSDGTPVAASSGLAQIVDGDLTELDRQDTLIICGGDNIATHSTPQVLNWIRRETRRGVRVGSVASATYTLALAGLLTGKQATVHWDFHNAMAESFPSIDLLERVFAIDGQHFTCAGGAASMDLMLYLIERDHGRELANHVAEKMVYSAPRSPHHNQRLSLQLRAGKRSSKLTEAVEIMNANIEAPLTPSEVATAVDLSSRQLERLFRKHLGTTPKTHYTGLRLRKARDLMFQTDMKLSEICFACGFNSQTHFSKAYRASFGVSPSRDDGRFEPATLRVRSRTITMA
ncbi:MAG: GlxA family transcriptional regulator [Shimia sp.]|uniref:GlxA family transcriptional regulator n=1 Tax=Shimia sp. TaxID=1954381 RepID=UPI00405881E7